MDRLHLAATSLNADMGEPTDARSNSSRIWCASGRRAGSASQAHVIILHSLSVLMLEVGGLSPTRADSSATVVSGRFEKGTSPIAMHHMTMAAEYTSIFGQYASCFMISVI